MKPILVLNETLYTTIVAILDYAILEKSRAENTEVILAKHMNKTLQEVQEILSEIKRGIMETNNLQRE